SPPLTWRTLPHQPSRLRPSAPPERGFWGSRVRGRGHQREGRDPPAQGEDQPWRELRRSQNAPIRPSTRKAIATSSDQRVASAKPAVRAFTTASVCEPSALASPWAR